MPTLMTAASCGQAKPTRSVQRIPTRSLEKYALLSATTVAPLRITTRHDSRPTALYH